MSGRLTESEEEALKEFKKELGTNQVKDEDCLRFLTARKFNVQRSLELIISHQNTRDKEDLLNINPWEEEVRKELISSKLTVFPERDHDGATVLLLTARLHFPSLTNHRAVLKGLVVQLDCALESLEAQRKGIVLIYDMTDSKFNNFDYDLSKKILNMLKGSYPARLKKVLIVMAPLWFKAPFKVLRHFILEKLRNRVHVIRQIDLPTHLPISSIPTHLQGTLQIDHRAWITKCLTSTICYNHSKPRLLPPITEQNHSTFPPLNICQKQLDSYFEGATNDLLTSVDPASKTNGMSNEDEETSDANTIPTLSSTSSSACHKTLTDSCLESDEDIGDDDDLGNGVECNMDDNVLYIDLRKDGGGNSKHDSTSQNSSSSRKRTASVSEFSEPPKRRPSSAHKDDPIIPTNEVAAFNDGDISFTDDSSSDDSPVIMDTLHIPGPCMTPSQIFHYWMMVGHKGLRDEYFAIASEPIAGSYHVCKSKVNRHRNRYSDIMCLDDTRVRLLLPSSSDGSDYINANYVDGYDKPRAYISTQGPLQKTLNEFWQMVWEQAVLVIVMTTRTVERGRLKCDQYWPLEANRVEQYGKLAVLNSGFEERNECVITTLVLRNLETMEMRHIKHVHYHGWPDHGTPESGDSFLDLMDFVRNFQEEQAREFLGAHPDRTEGSNHPLLVHCSAGIGRTGTFIALDILTRALKDRGTVDVVGTIRRIRNQRALSIQTPDQYLFCYEALLCYAKRIGLFSYDEDYDDEDENGDDDDDNTH